MSRYIFIARTVFLLTITYATSCKKDIKLNDVTSKFVVLAELTAGDKAHIPIGKSTVTRTGSAIEFEKIVTASVSLTDENNLVTYLRHNNQPNFANNPAAIYTSNQVIKYNQSYVLKADHPLLGSIVSTTHIPGPFSVINVSTEDKVLNGKFVQVFNFSIVDPPGERNYYIYEVTKEAVIVAEYYFWQGSRYDYKTSEGKYFYEQVSSQQNVPLYKDTIPQEQSIRLKVFTFDKRTENYEFGSLDSSFNRIFISDSSFNGNQINSFFAISKEHFVAKTNEQVGRVKVKIKSVSKELFTYLVNYERYRLYFGIMPAQQLASPKGNVTNGFGVFGGVSKKEWIYYYDTL